MNRWEGVGVPRGEVILAEHQQSWQRCFEREKQRLSEACGEKLTSIDHVGSTAIPGLLAKPLLDIAIGLASVEDGEKATACIVRLGYEYLGEQGIPGRFYFVLRQKVLRQETDSLAHIHMYEQGHHDLHNLVAFKTYLLHHPETVRAYGNLKRELYSRYKDDRPSYTSAKGVFIQDVLLKARQER